MTNLLLIIGIVLLSCIISSKVLYKCGIPILLIYIVLGMLFGSDGVIGIYFDDYNLTKELCSIALVIIMFYGGFGTNWEMAKPIAKPSVLMSTFGVIITASLIAFFCKLVLNTTLMEGFLIGSVVGSTDAASVFATLRSKKLNLKGSLASLLEIESGSNDPIAYTMTLITLSIMSNSESVNIPVLVIKQIIFGLLVGVLIAKLTIIIIREIKFEIKSFYTIFILTITILVYSFSDWIGGNGYLSVYIAGIIIGNSKIPHKKSTFHFFDGLTWIMQIALFFILGLLSFPSKIKDVLLISILISVFMILVARPIATFLILGRFKFSIKEKMFVSWVGLRGAASIVFAIFAITYGINIKLDIFHIVFFVALISVGLQGTLIPWVAKKLDLVDNNTTVLKTFNDYTSDKSTVLVEYPITNKSRIVNKTIMDSDIPEDILIVMIKRKGEVIVPKGSTVVLEGDTLVLTGNDKEFLLKIVNS